MVCTKCGEDKPADTDHFYVHSNTVSGLHPRCIECAKARSKELRQDPERRAYTIKRVSDNWHSKSAEEKDRIGLERRLKDRFKRTPQWYEDTLKAQGDHCALCDATEGTKRLHVDHDHACCPGRITCGTCVRALLCNTCNSRLGDLEATINELKVEMEPKPGTWTDKAMQYLASYKPTDTPPFDRLMTGLDEVANYLSKPTELQYWQVEQIAREFYGEIQEEAEARKMAENPTQLEKDFIW